MPQELVHERRGAGEPMVLIHGLGSRWQVWLPVLDAVAAHHEVIALDLPGFGASPPGGTPPTLDGLATAVEKFLARNGIQRAHLAGNSLGGGIALELGRRGAARSVTAFSPIGFWAVAGRHWSRAALTASRGLARRIPPRAAARLAASPAGRAAALSLFYGRTSGLDPQSVLADVAALAGAAYFDPVRRSLRDHLFTTNSELDAIPVTIAWGTRDVLLTYRTQSRRARALLPAARHVTLPGCGHLPFSDNPQLCAKLIIRTTE